MMVDISCLIGTSTAIVSLHDSGDVVRGIRGTAGRDQVIGIRADVSDGEQVRRMVQQVTDTFGGIDILVNSTGIRRYGDVVERHPP